MACNCKEVTPSLCDQNFGIRSISYTCVCNYNHNQLINIHLPACVLRLTISVHAGGLSPIEFSAYTRKNNSDLSFKFSMQCRVTDGSNVATFVHVFSEGSLISIT